MVLKKSIVLKKMTLCISPNCETQKTAAKCNKPIIKQRRITSVNTSNCNNIDVCHRSQACKIPATSLAVEHPLLQVQVEKNQPCLTTKECPPDPFRNCAYTSPKGCSGNPVEKKEARQEVTKGIIIPPIRYCHPCRFSSWLTRLPISWGKR